MCDCDGVLISTRALLAEPKSIKIAVPSSDNIMLAIFISLKTNMIIYNQRVKSTLADPGSQKL
jgi:hypothetical protein